MKVLFCHRVNPELQKHYQSSLPHEIELIFPMDSTDEVLLQYAPEINVAVGYKFSKRFLDQAKKLIHIQVPWTGAETLDFELLKEYPAITISNSHSNSLAIAEHAVALFTSAAKKIVYRDSAMRKGDWSTRYNEVMSHWLTGKTLGIIGYGFIGRKVAQMMKGGFNMQVLAIKNSIAEKKPEEVEFIGSSADIPYVLAESDYLLVALPSTPETKNLIGKKELSLLKPNAILVNIGRGEVINEQALYELLKENQFAGAGIDVWYKYPKDRKKPQVYQNYPFEKLPYIVLSPHSAFKVESREIPFAEDIIENINLIYNKKIPLNQIDLEKGY